MATRGAAKKTEVRILIVLLVGDVIKSKLTMMIIDYRLMLVYLMFGCDGRWMKKQESERGVYKETVLLIELRGKERVTRP